MERLDAMRNQDTSACLNRARKQARKIWIVGVTLLIGAFPLRAGWMEELEAMPLAGQASRIDPESAPVLLLESFKCTAQSEARALVLLPGATDELYFFKRIDLPLPEPRPSLGGLLQMLTNQTRLSIQWEPPLILVRTPEDVPDLDLILQNEKPREVLQGRRLNEPFLLDDRDFDSLQPWISKQLKASVHPWPGDGRTWHFYRHSLAGNHLSGWEMLQALLWAGQTGVEVSKPWIGSRPVLRFHHDQRSASRRPASAPPGSQP